MNISTPDIIATRFAGALYGVALSNQTMTIVTNYASTGTGGLDGLLNAVYEADFGSTAASSVATTIAGNLGLTGTASTEAIAYLTGLIGAAAPGTQGQVIADALNGFAQLTADATFGTFATAYENQVANADAYSLNTANTSNEAFSNISTTTPGKTFTLTTGVDSFTGSAGPDTYNATLGTSATLNAFDKLVAGAGTDTLNVVDSTAGAFAMPVSTTLSGFETVNLSRAAAAGATSIGVTVTDTTFGTGVQTLNITEAGGGTTAAAASVTLNSASTVSIVDSQATLFTTVAVTDTSTTAASTGSTLNSVTVTGSTGSITLTGNAINSVSLNNDGGLTTVTAAAGTRALTVNTSGTVTLGGLTDATATTVTVNNSGKIALGTFTTAAATTFNYNSTAADTSATITAAKATTLNVGGSAVATLTMTGNTAMTTVNVTGSAGLVTDLTAGATAVTLLDTTGTTGNSTVTVNTATAVNGGAGNDLITVGATTAAIHLGGGTNQVTLTSGTTALGTGGSIDGGTGTADVLVFAAAADAATLSTAGSVQTAFKAAVTNFEVLSLAAAAGDISVDAMGFGTFHTVDVTGAAHTVTIQNLASGDTINVTGANTGITTAGSTGSGVNDVINFGLKDSTKAIAAFGTFTTPNVETVNFHMTDTQTTPVGYLNTATLTDISVHSITIDGNSGLDLGTVTGATALTSFDASGVTGAGGVGITTDALQYASTFVGSSGTGSDSIDASAALAAVTITDNATGTNTLKGASGAYVDTITAGNGNNTITTGGGADVITAGTGNNTIVAGAGKDTITVGSGTNSITGGTGADTITINHGALTHVDTIVIGATGQTGAGITASGVLTGVDVVSGLAKADVIDISAIAGSIVSVTHETAFSGAEIAGTGTAAFLVQGTYVASTGVFTASATGTDSVFMYDNNGSTAAGSMEAVVLVGYHGASATAAAGVATLG